MANLTEPTTDIERAALDDLDRLPPALADDLAAAAETAKRSHADATRACYEIGWARWQGYCERHGLVDLPGAAAAVAAWAQHLAEQGVTCRESCCDPSGKRRPPADCEPVGLTAASVAVRIAAVSHHHRQTTDEHGQPVDDPTASVAVKRLLRGLRRTDAAEGRTQRQAKPFDETKLGEMKGALRARRSTGHAGRGRETRAAADRRACRDYALLRTLYSAMLRRSEAAALTWADLAIDDDDGTGLLTIRRSKGDQTGEGAKVFVGRATCGALRAWRDLCDGDDDALVFGLSASQVGRVVRRAALDAGLGDGYTGHSGRVGMAQHLAAEGAGLVAMTNAGRWSSPTMPARYARAVAAKKDSAVARHAKHS